MKTINILKMTLLVFVALACSQAMYHFQVAENADFTKYETFAFLPATDDSPFTVYDNEIVRDTTIGYIKGEMEERGYTLDTLNPGLLILPHYMFEREVANYYAPIRSTYTYYTPGLILTPHGAYYYRNYQTVPLVDGGNMRQVTYTEGTIVVDVIDAGSDKLLWRGWSEDRIDPNTFFSDIELYVNNIFRNFPHER